MAVSANSYYKNGFPGASQIGPCVDIFTMHAVPAFALGTRAVRGDGAEFVYSHFGADTNRAVLVATDVSESCITDTDNGVIAPASAVTTTDGTIGSRFVQCTLAAITANQLAGGYFVTTDDVGEGFCYRIKGNTATDTTATGDVRIELYDPLIVALDATTDYAIQGCLYANLELAVDGTDDCLAGITTNTMDVSEAAYGWVLAKGIWACLDDPDVPAIGDVLVLSSGVSGAVMGLGGTSGTTLTYLVSEEIVGTCLIAGDSTGHLVGKFNIS